MDSKDFSLPTMSLKKVSNNTQLPKPAVLSCCVTVQLSRCFE